MNRRALWSAAQAADATGGVSTADWQAFGVSIDTRTIAPGDLFVALAGPRFDGHDFVAAAFERGAAAALVHRRPEKLDDKAPLLLVDDTLGALWRLGAAARERSEARFVGITGSVGKTGTKEALAHCLSEQGPTAWSPGSFNNQWGLPLSLARIEHDARFGVFELGMNHAGEIRELVRLLKPHTAVVLNIEAAHIGYFGSLKEIAAAKAEIFEAVEPDGSAIINRDSPFFEFLAERARACGIKRIVGFGRHNEAQVRLIDSAAGENDSKVTAIVGGKRRDYRIALPGQHWIMNSLAVLAAVAELGADVARAADALARLKPIKGRGERHSIPVPGGRFLLIDDSYNANPASMRSAFDVLGRVKVLPPARRIAVLGDMRELGENSKAMHADLAKPLIEQGVDRVFLCGPEMEALATVLPARLLAAHVADSAALAPLVAAAVAPGDAVLVKGSLGSRMAVVIEALKALENVPSRAANGN